MMLFVLKSNIHSQCFKSGELTRYGLINAYNRKQIFSWRACYAMTATPKENITFDKQVKS